jgi:Uma2 family endonuclease
MPASAETIRKAVQPLRDPPPLQNGDRLTSHEFLRRYEAMPEVKKAELVAGIVYMGSPISVDHARPDNLLQTWLGVYTAETPGVECSTNATMILSPHNTPQPDACLCLKPSRGGQTRLNEKKYLVGAPELVAEIAASSVSLDLGDKMDAYAMAGVREYLVWRTLE